MSQSMTSINVMPCVVFRLFRILAEQAHLPFIGCQPKRRSFGLKLSRKRCFS